MPSPIHPLPSLRCLSGLATYAFYLTATRAYFLTLTSPPSSTTTLALDWLSSLLTAANQPQLITYVPTLSNAGDEVKLVSSVLFVLLLPQIYTSLISLSATHFPSIAPPYVSTLLGSFEHDHETCLSADGCPKEIKEQRRAAFQGLLTKLEKLFPKSSKM